MTGAVRSLRHRNFQLYFWGQFVSMIGTWMQAMAQMWLVYRLTHSSWLLGLIGFVSQAPFMLIGLFGGVVADRFDRRRVAVWTQSAALVQALALGLLTLAGTVTVWEVFVLSAVMGVINVFDMPARQSLVVELVTREDLGNAIALNTFMVNSSRLIGPAVAGFMVAWWGEGSVFLLNAASYIAAIVTLLMMVLPDREVPGETTFSDALAQVRDGLRYEFSDPQMSAMLRLLAAISLFGVPVMALLPIFADGILHAGPSGVGWLMAATGIGATVGSWFLAVRRDNDGLGPVVGSAAVAFGLSIAAFAYSKSFAFSLAAMMLTGWGMMTVFVGCNTLLQHLTSDEMRGRVMSLFSMTFMGVGPIGNLAAGAIAEHAGAPVTIAAGGALCVFASILFLRRSWARAAAAFAVVALMVLPGRAAELAPIPPQQPIVKTLSWDDCVALALGENPDLLSASRASEASKASYLQSYNGLMPSLTLSDTYNASRSGGGVPSYTAQAAASVNIFNASSIASIRENKATYRESTAALRNESATLRQTLRRAFAQVLSAEKTVDVNRQIVEMRRKSAQLVTLRYQSGHEYKGNMMTANAQLFQAEAALAQALRDLRTARRSLDRQLGLDDFAEVTATGALAAAAPPELPRLQDYLEGRPDVAQQEAVVAGAKAAVASAESPLFPSLTGNYTRFRAGTAEFPPSGYGWTAGATLSYPLFGGGPTSTYFGVKSAKRSLGKSQQDLRSVRDAALLDLETSWSSYATAVDAVQVQTSLLDAARQRNAEADVRYASGLLTFDNWELIVTERVSAEQSAIQAEFNAVVAQASWEKSLGRALGE